MLTTDEVQKIYMEVMRGEEPTRTDAEALEMRHKIKQDKKKADDNGVILEMPFEWPD